MSNPIADNTDYFKEKIPKELPNHNYHRYHNDFDPKDQWRKVIKKINKYHQDSTGRVNTPTTSNITSDTTDDSDYYGSNITNDNSSISSSDIPHTAEYYEMQRLNRVEDDVLPSAEEMNQENNVEQPSISASDRNYFQNPFSPTEDGPSLPLVEPDPAARKHWGKTLDKVRLIANLHTLPQKKSSDHPPQQQAAQIPSLSPYYPPLFDPPFIALSKDEHGNPWVSSYLRDRT